MDVHYAKQHVADEILIETQPDYIDEEHCSEEGIDAGYWFLLQVTMHLFFYTQWPRTAHVDFEELSTKLQRKSERARIPGA